MQMRNWLGKLTPIFGALEILKYIGPRFLVTVGFIDPCTWASKIIAGSPYAYSLLADGYPFDPHADSIAAQLGPPQDSNRALAFRYVYKIHGPFNPAVSHSRMGVLITLIHGLLVVFLLHDPFSRACMEPDSSKYTAATYHIRACDII